MENLVGGADDTLDFSTYSGSAFVDLENDQVVGFDTVTGFSNVIGSDQDDTLIGDSAVNTILGGGGDDTDEIFDEDSELF